MDSRIVLSLSAIIIATLVFTDESTATSTSSSTTAVASSSGAPNVTKVNVLSSTTNPAGQTPTTDDPNTNGTTMGNGNSSEGSSPDQNGNQSDDENTGSFHAPSFVAVMSAVCAVLYTVISQR